MGLIWNLWGSAEAIYDIHGCPMDDFLLKFCQRHWWTHIIPRGEKKTPKTSFGPTFGDKIQSMGVPRTIDGPYGCHKGHFQVQVHGGGNAGLGERHMVAFQGMFW